MSIPSNEWYKIFYDTLYGTLYDILYYLYTNIHHNWASKLSYSISTHWTVSDDFYEKEKFIRMKNCSLLKSLIAVQIMISCFKSIFILFFFFLLLFWMIIIKMLSLITALYEILQSLLLIKLIRIKSAICLNIDSINLILIFTQIEKLIKIFIHHDFWSNFNFR